MEQRRAPVQGDDKNNHPAGAPTRQPPYVLAVWIQDLLREMRQAHIAQLEQARQRLQSTAFDWDDAQLAAAVTALHSSGRELHFMALRHGWFARLLGRHRAAHARFVAACTRIAACASELRAQAKALSGSSQEAMHAARRALLEIGLEVERFSAAIDQGVTWLQDMCTQLADARGQGSEDPQLASLAEAAQLFTQEFKRLQAVSSMANDLCVRGSTVLQRRAVLLAQVQADMERFDKVWTPRLGPLLADLKAGLSPAGAIPKAAEAHEELMKRLAASADACGALQHEEHLLAQELALWREELKGPAH